jgi:hypothetical protein
MGKKDSTADWFIIDGAEASGGSRNAKRLTLAAL